MSSDPEKLSAASCTLAKEYEAIMNEPCGGFRVSLVNDNDLFEWEVGIFGPPTSIYRGGYFRARMRFPEDYPFSPPVVRFIDEICHPNIRGNGSLCLTALPIPTETEHGVQLGDQWNPSVTARTIILSIISLINNPNMVTPANRVAAELYRLWRDSNGEIKAFYNMVRRQANETNFLATRMGIVVPKTVEEYSLKTTKTKPESVNNGPDKNAEAENSNLNNENSSLPPTTE